MCNRLFLSASPYYPQWANLCFNHNCIIECIVNISRRDWFFTILFSQEDTS